MLLKFRIVNMVINYILVNAFSVLKAVINAVKDLTKNVRHV